MTLYQKPSFTVPASGENKLPCAHGWVAKGRCVLCGVPVIKITFTSLDAKITLRQDRE